MELRNELSVEADVRYLTKIRTFIQDTLSAMSLTQSGKNDIVLAVDEAATNIILHGYKGSPGSIDIELKGNAGVVTVCLRDLAPSFDPTKVPAPDLTLPLEKRPIGNLGLHIIRHLVDDIVYETPTTGGNQLTLIKNVSINEI